MGGRRERRAACQPGAECAGREWRLGVRVVLREFLKVVVSFVHFVVSFASFVFFCFVFFVLIIFLCSVCFCLLSFVCCVLCVACCALYFVFVSMQHVCASVNLQHLHVCEVTQRTRVVFELQSLDFVERRGTRV